MFERKQTINGVEYSYQYGGHGTIAITEPIRATIDLKHLPDISVSHDAPLTEDQITHLDGALQAIVSDMFAQIPKG